MFEPLLLHILMRRLVFFFFRELILDLNVPFLWPRGYSHEFLEVKSILSFFGAVVFGGDGRIQL